MRELPLSTLLALALAGCSGSSESLPSGDGYGPLSNGTNTPAPTSTSTPAPTSPPSAPTSAPPPSSAPTVDAGAGGWDAGGWPAEAGAYDAGAVTTESGVPSTLLSLCVGEINEVRNQNGAFPYAESSQLEAYAAQAAASDAVSGQGHGYFSQTSGGGVASTEDEFDGDNVDPGGTAQQVLSQGLLDDEQNENGGFDNLVTNQFSEVGCGFAQDAAGNWWVTLEFQ